MKAILTRSQRKNDTTGGLAEVARRPTANPLRILDLGFDFFLSSLEQLIIFQAGPSAC